MNAHRQPRRVRELRTADTLIVDDDDPDYAAPQIAVMLDTGPHYPAAGWAIAEMGQQDGASWPVLVLTGNLPPHAAGMTLAMSAPMARNFADQLNAQADKMESAAAALAEHAIGKAAAPQAADRHRASDRKRAMALGAETLGWALFLAIFAAALAIRW